MASDEQARRHHTSTDRHKEAHRRTHLHKDCGHGCICGYAKCPDTFEGFEGTGHVFDRRPIRFRVPPCTKAEDGRLWGEFLGSLFRNLHVPDAVQQHIRAKGEGYRFDVRAHHFTEEVVRQYWNNERINKRWALRFDRGEARNFLHLPLDLRDTDRDGKFFLNANHPMVDAASLVVALNSDRGGRASSRSSDDSEKEAMRLSLEKKKSAMARKDDELKEKDRIIASMKEEIRALKQTSRRRKERAISASADNKRLRDELEGAYTMEDVTDILVKIGGLSRATLFSNKFHKKYPDAAKCMWGFESFEETLVMVECLFEDVDVSAIPVLHPNKRQKSSSGADSCAKMGLPNLTPLEKCLICKLFFRRDLNEEFIGLIFGRHRTTIGKVLKEWAPRWGKAGEQCSILDITREYLDGEEPARSAIVGVRRAVNVDGADTGVEKCRKDGTADALLFGAKNETEAARSLNWVTAGGLSIEHTKEFCARASEKAVFELHGSLGKRKAPLAEWKNVGIGLTSKQRVCRLAVATEDMFDYHDMEETIDALRALQEDRKREVLDGELAGGGVDDGVLLTATLEEVEAMHGVRSRQSTKSRSKLPATTTTCKIPTIADIDEWFVHREAVKIVQAKSTKMAPLIEADVLDEQNMKALEGGVNSSGIEKLAQYEVHERLHRAYEGKRLKKTMLAYYLLAMKDDRHKVLKWLGSELAPRDIPMPSEADLPDIWLRLAKVPHEYEMLGDKGFFKADRYNPNINHVRTPWKLSDEEVRDYRRSEGMIKQDRETSDTRVVVEDDYERYRNEGILKGTVPYWVIAMLPYAHEWGHANMNILDPLRKPGKSSIVSDRADYWDKHNC